MNGHDWDDPAYLRIAGARYDDTHDQLWIDFANGDTVAMATWRLLRSTVREPCWSDLQVVDSYYVSVPAAPGTGDAGTDTTDIPGLTIRSIVDPLFALHLAREAELSARRVGTRLQQLRKARGFTTRQVADRIGMAQQNYSRIEQGRHAVSYATLEKILAAMGYSLQDIMEDAYAAT